ncbi:PQQ-dependent sugar dehydrogenase [Mucilaginibacter sp. UR6-11]|uniref:PQQ-dependent sugar dehydrogenase n=1 Tax=Mucilaginibacter sp. UR6-11 TaxID=1435644 RepID=UPI001E645A55|nr:PQQ-dependent sugar dehydrogenase [Mucilaginibacter sp. UR6-11]MCC8424535.1 PQQ-dependent sugar dehydrogenase [Mucilaginibacter sp. UR6-11]
MRKQFILSGLITAAIFFNAKAQNAVKPDENRFTKVVLAQRIEEPMQFQILKDGKVIYAERKGKLKLYDPATQQITVIHEFAVSTKYVSQTGEVSEAEDGLQGVILDPDFYKNHWIYVYYSPAGNDPKNSLERYTWDGKGPLDVSSRKKVMDVVVQRFECCHVGGGMVFDKNKNLYLSTGDNTFSRASDGFSPLDERPGMFTQDSQKGSSNTNDLRGKILRIHPEADGSYTVPQGNLFPKGTPKTRPEIYTMGNRNPWRLTIDSKTGWLYWGEVGPDGSTDDFEHRGPQSYDEFNQAKKPGNYGWPYFVGNNFAYHHYNFATKESGPLFDPAHPVNTSPNNTGLTDLPPATPAFIYYSKQKSERFPLLESGGNSAVGGPIFHAADFAGAPRTFPSYYEGKWFITDWVRGWINVVSIDNNGNYTGMERFLPELKLRGPIDMKFGPNGDLYVLEYGNGYFKDNPEAELIRIEYNGGNRKPQVHASVNKTAGAVPLRVKLSAAGTTDADTSDRLSFLWKITRNGVPFKTQAQANPSVTFTLPGTYRALLTVTDSKGAKNSQSVEVKAGNEPPVVKFNITAGNSSFFFPGKTINYNVSVVDKEDGSLANRRIAPSHISVSADYLSEGYNMTAIASKQGAVDANAQSAGGWAVIAKNDCRACHSVTEKVLGPSFTQVALKYKDDAGAPDRLAKKILAGGSGNWGDAMMPAHPGLSDGDVKSIVKYVLGLAYAPPKAKPLPVSGTFTTTVPEGKNPEGSFILRAAYTDRGAKGIAAQTGEQTVVLNAPTLPVSKATESHNIYFGDDGNRAQIKNAGWLRFNRIDLNGIKQISLITTGAAGNGTVEIHANFPQGKLIASGSYGNSLTIPEGQGVADLYFLFNGSPVAVRAIKFSDGN